MYQAIPIFWNGMGRDGTISEIVTVLFYGTEHILIHANSYEKG